MKADRIISTNNKNSDNTLKQGTILAVASVLSRIIGMLYRSPMTHIIGDEGNGLYGYAFEIYSYALILSTYCMPLAVSKLLSARFATKEYHNGMKIFRASMLFSVISGGIMALLVFAFAGVIERFTGYDGVALPLRILAPTIFVVAIAGTLRGFFQSRKTMLPTALSQLGEQVINAIVSIVAPIGFITLATNALDRASYGAAGGTLGTLFGALAGVFFLIFLYVIYKPRMERHLSHDKAGETLTNGETVRLLAATILPIILSQAVYQSIGILDGTLFGKLYTGEDKTVLYNLYSGKYRLMVNVPNAISSSLASSMIPNLVSLYTLGHMTEFRRRLGNTMKFNMIIAFPCAAGLAALSSPILRLLFPTTDYTVSGQMLFVGAIAVIFYALSTVSNAALQGLDRLNLPLRHAAISLAIHLVLIIFLLCRTGLGAFALVIGNITYPLIVCILNWISVAKHASYHQEVRTTFLLPAASALAMGVVTWIVRKLLSFILPDSYWTNLLIILVCMVLAVVIYFVLIFKTGALRKEDMPEFPMGMRIYRVAKKLHLME